MYAFILGVDREKSHALFEATIMLLGSVSNLVRIFVLSSSKQ
jgi:hypothetical protein